MGKMPFKDNDIEAMIKGIESGLYDNYNLPVKYYNALVEYLSKAVFDGFGADFTTVSMLDTALLNELTNNIYMFGAAKTFQQTKEISSLLVDENGKIRSSSEFNKIARDTYDNWNNNWGVTEYNTAIAQADAAAKWADIERQQDVMPYLEYSTIGDACTICKPLDGIIAPVNDAIWNKVAPTNHFGCMCILLQRNSDVKTTENNKTIVNGVVEKMKEKKQDIFINNVGKTGEIFTKDHPYFEVPQQYKNFAMNNFNLPIPKR